MVKLIQELDRLEKTMLGAALISGLVHLVAAYRFSFPLLALAGAGFLGGTLLFLQGRFRVPVVAAALPYTGAQIVIYYDMFGVSLGLLSAFDKAVQLVFLATATIYLWRKTV